MCIYLKFKISIYISKNIYRLPTRLQSKYSRIKLQNTFLRPLVLHKIINFQENQNILLKLSRLSLYCQLCAFIKDRFWYLIVIPAYENYTENQERYSWNLIEILSNYKLDQRCLNFTVNYVDSKKSVSSNQEY